MILSDAIFHRKILATVLAGNESVWIDITDPDEDELQWLQNLSRLTIPD